MSALLVLRALHAAAAAAPALPQAVAALRGLPSAATGSATGAATGAATSAVTDAATGAATSAAGIPAASAPPVNTGGAASTAAPTTATGDTFPTILLTCLVWSALAVAFVVLLLPERTREQRDRIRVMGLVGAGAPLLLALGAMNFQIGQDLLGGQTSFVENHAWLTQLAVHVDYRLAADGISLPLLLVATVVFGVAMVTAWRVERHPRLLVALLLAMETGVTGMLVAHDLVLFVLFGGIETAAAATLIAGWGGAGARRAARRLAVAGTASGVLLLASALLVGTRGGQGNFGFLTDIGPADAGVVLGGGVAALACGLALAAFLLRLPLAPFHGWYVDALAEAPTPVAAAVAGGMSTVGGYGLMRIVLAGFPTEVHRLSLPLALLALLSAAWAGMRALAEDDLRRLVAHVCTASRALVLLAVAAQTGIALAGATLLLAADALAGALLVVVAATVQERSRVREVSRLGGLAWQAPRLAALWAVGGLSLAGLPFLAAFWGMLQVVIGAYGVHRLLTLGVLACTLLPAAAMLRACLGTFFGASREQFQRVRDAGALDLLAAIPLVAGIVILGVVPGRFLPVISNGVQIITARLVGG